MSDQHPNQLKKKHTIQKRVLVLLGLLAITIVAVVVVAGSRSGGNAEDAKVEEAVKAYSEAYLAGDGGAAWELLSSRCQKVITREQLALATAMARGMYGPHDIASYRAEVAGGKARVTYTYATAPDINQSDQPWVREGDAWRNDHC